MIPEIHDLVAVTENYVDYYGYVAALDLDVRFPMVKVEFFPGKSRWFELKNVRPVKFPEDNR